MRDTSDTLPPHTSETYPCLDTVIYGLWTGELLPVCKRLIDYIQSVTVIRSVFSDKECPEPLKSVCVVNVILQWSRGDFLRLRDSPLSTRDRHQKISSIIFSVQNVPLIFERSISSSFLQRLDSLLKYKFRRLLTLSLTIQALYPSNLNRLHISHKHRPRDPQPLLPVPSTHSSLRPRYSAFERVESESSKLNRSLATIPPALTS